MDYLEFVFYYISANICGDKCLYQGEEDHRLYCQFHGFKWESAQCQSQDWQFQAGASKKICQCGQQTMNINELQSSVSYCCSPDDQCQDQGYKIVCQNGTLVNWNDKCGNECPTAKGVSAMAIATKTACNNEGKCFKNRNRFTNTNSVYSINEVCDHGQKNESDFAEKFCGRKGSVPCFNNVTQGIYNSIRQCYNTNYIG